ncbi:HAUS augmin-like complex subunit 6 isoform X2 [Lissotriton helveticus]
MSWSGAQPWHSRYLWLQLQALGFQDAPPPAGKTLNPATLGVHMFDKPNRDAFYIVVYFLFSRLDPPRCKETFRYCWPPMDKKRDAEFRKLCCEWLRSISDECGSEFPQVVASLFLSPGGPKFIFLMFNFAKYVVLQQIKKVADEDFLFDSLNTKPKDIYTAVARNKVAQIQFFQIVQKEDAVLQEYKRKAQLLTKQIRDLRSESASLQSQLLKMEEKHGGCQNPNESNQRVRSMWASIMEIMTSLKKEKEIVDLVITGHVDQYTLDGTDASVNIPRLLVNTIAHEIDNLQIENIYEAGKLNLVSLVQLLNQSLKLLIQERRQVDKIGLQLDLQYLEVKTKFEKEVMSKQRKMRYKIRHNHLMSLNKSIHDQQQAWESKWKKELGKSPFHAIKRSELGFETSVAHLLFEPAEKDALKSSVFCQYPPSFSDLDVRMSLKSRPEPSTITPLRRIFSVAQLTPGKSPRRPLQTGSRGGTPKPKPSAKRCEDIRELVRQQPVDQVVAENLNESHNSASEKGMTMEDIIGALSSDPFSTKKQIPRTPETLISDIRNSWREAIQCEDLSDLQKEPLQLEVVPKESSDKLASLHTKQSLNENKTVEHSVLLQDRQVQPRFLEDVANAQIAGKDKPRSLFSQVYDSKSSTLSWDSSQWMGVCDGSDSREGIEFGIIQKTPQEEHAHMSLNTFKSLEIEKTGEKGNNHNRDDYLMDNIALTNKVSRPDKMEIQAIRNRLEELKRNMRKSSLEVEDLYQSPDRKCMKRRSVSCASLQGMLKRETFSPVESKLTLDLDYLERTPTRSLSERKRTFPPFSNILTFDESFTSIEHEDLPVLELQDDEPDDFFMKT